MQGSYSIKVVLPTVAPELNYKALDQVHIGGEAQVALPEFIDSKTDAKRKAQLEQDGAQRRLHEVSGPQSDRSE